jgi:hypothetical protein
LGATNVSWGRLMSWPYLSILNRWSHFPAHARYPPHQVSLSNPSLPRFFKSTTSAISY